MSPKSSRQSSPRAMPVETIITRFKSAQQKRQLREMDRSMTKVTKLLKSPSKSKMKKKVPLKKTQRSRSTQSVKEVAENEKTTKNNKDESREVEVVNEYCPLNLKRKIVLNKVKLKPKHELKIIAQTNKRKRSTPKKGIFPQEIPEISINSEQSSLSRGKSPLAKRSKLLTQDISMDEMIQLIEDSGSLDDEDLLEILTCPSPVWWEDPPDGYIEDALFTRPHSTADMYPSIQYQLHENFEGRKRSNTPNILSRKEKNNSKQGTKSFVIKENEKEELSNNNNIDLGIMLSKCDEKFVKKRSKLECVLGNLKKKTYKNNDLLDKVTKTAIISNVSSVSDKVSVIKNLFSEQIIKNVERSENNNINLNVNTDTNASDCIDNDSDNTDDEHLTDLSFHDDAYLNDLENMDIPMQENTCVSPSKQFLEEKKNVHISEYAIDLEEKINNQYARAKSSTLNKRNTRNDKENPIDPTYSDRESSIIEDYFEMNMFEGDDNIVNKKQNEYLKSEFQFTPIKCKYDCKQIDTKCTSVEKFRNFDNTSINVLKIDNTIPKNLPPLKNSDRRKGNAGCVPENLPPLKRNPVVIQMNSESPRSNKSTTSVDTSESYGSVTTQDNMDSISDTNICFLNEEEEDYIIEKKIDNNHELDVSTVMKCNNANYSNESNSNDLSFTGNDILFRNELKCNENEIYPSNQFVNPYKIFPKINYINNNELNKPEFQSLTISKMSDHNCCQLEENKQDVLKLKRKGNNSCDETIQNQYIKSEHLNTIASETFVQNELDTEGLNEIEKTEHQYIKSEHLNTIASETFVQNELDVQVHHKIGKTEDDSTECVAVYKIVSDDSGNEESKNDLMSKISKPESKIKNLQNYLDPRKFNSDHKPDGTEKLDYNKDKMIFYFKKCKNLYWKHKNSDNIEDKNAIIENNEVSVNKNESIDKEKVGNEDIIDDVKTINILDNRISDDTKELSNNSKDESNYKVNHNNNLTNSDTKEQKCIIVPNTKQIRYCMKCSSIFDTAQCNYCSRKNGTDTSHCADYLSQIEGCFICDVCRYKTFSKDSLERHISSLCCDSKRR